MGGIQTEGGVGRFQRPSFDSQSRITDSPGLINCLNTKIIVFFVAVELSRIVDCLYIKRHRID